MTKLRSRQAELNNSVMQEMKTKLRSKQTEPNPSVLRNSLAKLNKRKPAELNHNAWKKRDKTKLRSRQAKLRS